MISNRLFLKISDAESVSAATAIYSKHYPGTVLSYADMGQCHTFLE